MTMQDYFENNKNLALAKFEQMLKSNKVVFFDSEEFEDIIYYYLDLGKLNYAAKAIELSLMQHPSSLSLKLIKVELLVLQDKLNEANKILNYIEKMEPFLDEIHIQRASILSKRGKHEAAIESLQVALMHTNTPEEIHPIIGMEYLYLDNFVKAGEHFQVTLTIDKLDYGSLFNAIYCLDMVDNHAGAIEFLNNYIDGNPYSEVAWHQLAKQHATLNQYNLALRAFNYAILIDENFVGAYFEKAKILEELEQYNNAILNYEKVLELDDATAMTYIKIANCYRELKDTKKALSFYHKAVIEDPLMETTWLAITSIYLEQDNCQKALYFIKKAIDVDDSNPNLLIRLAEINVKLHLFEEAAEALKKAINLYDDRLEVFIMLTDILHYIGEYKDALVILNKGLITNPDAVEIFYRLSGIHYILRNEKESFVFLEKALKKDVASIYILEELYISMLDNEQVQQLIATYKNE